MGKSGHSGREYAPSSLLILNRELISLVSFSPHCFFPYSSPLLSSCRFSHCVPISWATKDVSIIQVGMETAHLVRVRLRWLSQAADTQIDLWPHGATAGIAVTLPRESVQQHDTHFPPGFCSGTKNKELKTRDRDPNCYPKWGAGTREWEGKEERRRKAETKWRNMAQKMLMCSSEWDMCSFVSRGDCASMCE